MSLLVEYTTKSVFSLYVYHKNATWYDIEIVAIIQIAILATMEYIWKCIPASSVIVVSHLCLSLLVLEY